MNKRYSVTTNFSYDFHDFVITLESKESYNSKIKMLKDTSKILKKLLMKGGNV